jgi:outer membrane protein
MERKKMTGRKLLLSVVLMLALPFTAAAEMKIGAVSVSKLMEGAPQTKAADDALKLEFGDREKKLLDQQAEIRKLEEAYQRDKDILSAAEREKRQNALRDQVHDFKRDSEAFAEDLNQARNKALSKLQNNIYKAIVEIAEQEKYDLIVSESILYASKRVDITDKILKRLKEITDK